MNTGQGGAAATEPDEASRRLRPLVRIAPAATRDHGLWGKGFLELWHMLVDPPPLLAKWEFQSA